MGSLLQPEMSRCMQDFAKKLGIDLPVGGLLGIKDFLPLSLKSLVLILALEATDSTSLAPGANGVPTTNGKHRLSPLSALQYVREPALSWAVQVHCGELLFLIRRRLHISHCNSYALSGCDTMLCTCRWCEVLKT